MARIFGSEGKWVTRKAMRRILILTIFWLCIFQLSAQDSTGFSKVSWLPVPAFGYSPETETYVGAVLLTTLKRKDTLTRTSNLKVELNYTWRRQFITEFQWTHFTFREKWLTEGIFHFSRYPDKYFGKGASTPDSFEVNYQSDRYRLEGILLKNLGDQLFVGGGIRYVNYTRFRNNSDTLDRFSELSALNTIGVQLIGSLDRRDQVLAPSKGYLLKFMNDHMFSRSYYSKVSFDARKYFSWGKNVKQILSLRFYTQHVMGEAPFFDQSLLGGDKLIRGYFYGRFRDDHLSLIQAEYRSHLFWRIGASVFGGVGAVYNSFDWNNDQLKPNGGIGLRFLVDKAEGTNLRFDYAIGRNGQSGFYVSFGESF